MERENRYLVFKRTDIEKYLNYGDKQRLTMMARTIKEYRAFDGRADFECVVVESDWPEYEPTWQAIEKRADSLCVDCKGTGIIAVGTSGSESDGNCVVTEPCPSCDIQFEIGNTPNNHQ